MTSPYEVQFLTSLRAREREAALALALATGHYVRARRPSRLRRLFALNAALLRRWVRRLLAAKGLPDGQVADARPQLDRA